MVLSNVQNDDVRRTTKQPHLSATDQTRHFSTFLTASAPPGEPEETIRGPHTTCIKTIQQDLKSNNLSLNVAVDMETDVYVWHYALLWLNIINKPESGEYLHLLRNTALKSAGLCQILCRMQFSCYCFCISNLVFY